MMRRYTKILLTATAIAGASPGLAAAIELQPYSHVYSVTANVGEEPSSPRDGRIRSKKW